MERALLRRDVVALFEILGIGRTTGNGPSVRNPAKLSGAHPAWRLKGLRRETLCCALDEVCPDRESDPGAVSLLSDYLRLVEPDPDSGYQRGRKAHEPRIAEVVRRPRFSARRNPQSELPSRGPGPQVDYIPKHSESLKRHRFRKYANERHLIFVQHCDTGGVQHTSYSAGLDGISAV